MILARTDFSYKIHTFSRHFIVDHLSINWRDYIQENFRGSLREPLSDELVCWLYGPACGSWAGVRRCLCVSWIDHDSRIQPLCQW